jgi:hypothetical protein
VTIYLAFWPFGPLAICDYIVFGYLAALATSGHFWLFVTIYLATWLPWLPLAISGHLATWLSDYLTI